MQQTPLQTMLGPEEELCFSSPFLLSSTFVTSAEAVSAVLVIGFVDSLPFASSVDLGAK